MRLSENIIGGRTLALVSLGMVLGGGLVCIGRGHGSVCFSITSCWDSRTAGHRVDVQQQLGKVIYGKLHNLR
jgi:hypothetical protein